MTKNPFVNAFLAALYIFVIVSVISWVETSGVEDTILMPIAFLSLFTLSAAVMGYLFLYQPLQLYLNGEKTAALNTFLKTLGTFAGITVLIFVVLFLAAGF